MADPLPHERPDHIVLPLGAGVAELAAALAHATRHADVRSYALPAPWFLERAGVDLAAALPHVRTLAPDTLGAVLETLARLCTPAALSALAERVWREADERVRQHFLQQGAVSVLKGIFRLGPRSVQLAPPAEFVKERVYEHRLELVYRLAPQGPRADLPAPPEEGSLIVYPFDLAGALGAAELGLAAAHGPVIECFAYGWQHARHREFWERLAADVGGRVLP
jgi:hypothetical protein